MRSTFLLLLPLLCASASVAQDAADKIAQESCSCFEGMDGANLSDEQTTQFGACMIGNALPYSKELKKKFGIDLDKMDEETGEKLGVLIASRMIVQCPGFAEFAMAMANADETEEAAPEAPRNITATVQETKPGQFLTVVVRKDDGATIELLLLEHVSNAERVYEDPAKARGLKADWTYVEREFFDPYTRSYKTYHVITEIAPTEP